MTDNFEQSIIHIDQVLPKRVHVIPILKNPVFPGLIFPLHISKDLITPNFEKLLKEISYIGILLLKHDDHDFEELEEFDFYKVGTIGKILKVINLPDGSKNIFLNPLKRIKIDRFISIGSISEAVISYPAEILKIDKEVKAMMRNLLGDVKELIADNPLFTEEMKLGIINIDEPGKMADYITSLLNIDSIDKQNILKEFNVKLRLQKVSHLIVKEKDISKLQKKIQRQINEKISKQQREFFLKEELKQIKKELGMEVDPKSEDYENFKKKLESFNLKGEVKEKTFQELEKFKLMEPVSSEYFVVKKYIETICSLPWNIFSDKANTLAKAEKILDKDHYGLEEVKKRILEFIAIQVHKKETSGNILCLVGPPGVGKTSVGRSVARAMNRKFFRFSVGGMRDEAEIKGHRRTYVGAMPGKILQALTVVKTNNPVIMLDEIDKMGASYQGDPASALLEVLDPEQNSSFRDHYLDLPFDLSNVLFITTANTLDTIPPALLDRMDVIRLSGYIEEEKIQIARKYLIPKSINSHGLTPRSVLFDKSSLNEIVRYYSREAGVRNFEKIINKIIRKITFDIVKEKEKNQAEAVNKSLKKKKKTIEQKLKITQKDIKNYLKERIYTSVISTKITKPGIVIGLAWTPLGGDVLTIESILLKPKGELKLTGQLGNVMQESANIAYSYIRSISKDYNIDPAYFIDYQLHVHVPAGATPKDGPSAGVTLATSLLSVLLNKKIKNNIAMTGELSLIGNVLPVGGIKEKVIAAKRNKMKMIIIPKDNEKDLREIPDYIKAGITFLPVSRVEEVFDAVF